MMAPSIERSASALVGRVVTWVKSLIATVVLNNRLIV